MNGWLHAIALTFRTPNIEPNFWLFMGVSAIIQIPVVCYQCTLSAQAALQYELHCATKVNGRAIYRNNCRIKDKQITPFFLSQQYHKSCRSQWLRLALSNGPNWGGLSCPIHLRTETDPVSETLWFFVIYTRRWIKSKINLIVLYKILLLSVHVGIKFLRPIWILKTGRNISF
jgi:hypothetical protein